MNSQHAAYDGKTWLRIVVFVLLTAFMVYGPIYRQVFDGRDKFFKIWNMFALRGIGVVDARFYLVNADGTKSPIDRYSVLGLSAAKPNNNPVNSRFIHTRHGGAMQVAERLCKALDKETVIMVDAQVATPTGWEQTHENTSVECKVYHE